MKFKKINNINEYVPGKLYCASIQFDTKNLPETLDQNEEYIFFVYESHDIIENSNGDEAFKINLLLDKSKIAIVLRNTIINDVVEVF